MDIIIRQPGKQRYEFRTCPETNRVLTSRLYGWSGVDTGTLIVVHDGHTVVEQYFLRSIPGRRERVIAPMDLANALAEFYGDYETTRVVVKDIV